MMKRRSTGCNKNTHIIKSKESLDYSVLCALYSVLIALRISKEPDGQLESLHIGLIQSPVQVLLGLVAFLSRGAAR